MAVKNQVKDIVIEKTAEDLGQSLALTEDVLRWMFKDVVKCLKHYTQVEVSGLGTFLMSPAKLKRRIEKLERIKGFLEARPQSEERDEKLNITNTSLEYYYLKTNEISEKRVQANSRGLSQSNNSPGENEGGNSEGQSREAGNMQELS